MLTKEQREARRTFIGGSDAAAVLGLARFTTPMELFLEKRGEIPDLADDEISGPMEWGNRLEDVIAQAYAEKTGRVIQKVQTVTHPEYPWMGVNMDYIITNDPRGPGYLEVKNYGEWAGGAIYSLADVPDEVFVQVQHGIETARLPLGVHWGAVVILIGGQRLFYDDVERDESLIAVLIEQERAFWKNTQAGIAPKDTRMSADTLKRMYPKDSGKTITQDSADVARVARKLVELKGQAKEIEEAIEDHQTFFKLLMEQASVLTIAGFGEMTWKASRTGSKVVLDEGKLKRDFPKIYADCLKKVPTGGSRSFLVKPAKEEKAKVEVCEQQAAA